MSVKKKIWISTLLQMILVTKWVDLIINDEEKFNEKQRAKVIEKQFERSCMSSSSTNISDCF